MLERIDQKTEQKAKKMGGFVRLRAIMGIGFKPKFVLRLILLTIFIVWTASPKNFTFYMQIKYMAHRYFQINA